VSVDAAEMERRVGVGEILRRLERMDAESARRFDAIERKLDDGVFIRADVHEAKEQAAEEKIGSVAVRVGHLEDWQTWATRSLIGAGIGILVEAVMVVFALVKVFGK
jgi:hypothetical protein